MGHWLLHWLGMDNGAGPIYLGLSGFISDLGYLSGIAAALAVYKRFTCHTWWCPRHGLYDFTDVQTGLTFKLCRHCHPAHPGHRLSRRHIAHIHRRNQELARQGKGEAQMSQHTIPVPFRAGHVPGEKPVRQQHLAAAAASGSKVLLADLSEFQPDIDDAAYLRWSQAVVVRALYGTSHIDKAWRGGVRRSALHQGGVRFAGVYQFLVAGQDGAAQARAFHSLVGAIQPGEVFIADAEQGAKSMLTAWYSEMVKLYGTAIERYLWTYTGLAFGEETGLLPVQWIAAYQSAEPSTPHQLWQFTDRYKVPGVGTCDCSVFHGTISELAALAYGGQQPQQVATWVTQGQKSLHDLCTELGTQCSTTLRLTAEHSPGRVFTPAMAGYVNGVLGADTLKVPPGVKLRLGSEWFTSTGHQTMEGISLGRKIAPATILRETCEASSNGLFADGLAAYLNAVFARSTVHVPADVRLYYQK